VKNSIAVKAVAMAAFSVLAVGCGVSDRRQNPPACEGAECECTEPDGCNVDPEPPPVVVCPRPTDPLPPLQDKASLYEDALDVWTMHLEIADQDGLARVDRAEREPDDSDVRVDAVFRHDGEYGEQANQPNATLQVRGRSTRLALQKSYKISIRSGLPSWRGQREINLNKHPYDLTRVRNKLAFDLLRQVSNFASMRTRFVHLYINGESRGLYTYIEEPDKRYLGVRGFDPKGALYKAERFNFGPMDAQTAQDPQLFEKVVERHGEPAADKFKRMVDAVNDRSSDIDQVVAKYFNRDNYITWIAVNVLTGNIDTGSSNYYLYSPSGCEGWYFLPWDYDGALEFYDQPGNPNPPRWRAGLSNWWLGTLHERFLRDPNNAAAVVARVEELRAQVFTDAAVNSLMDAYAPVVGDLVQSAPDVWNLPVYNPEMRPLGVGELVAQWQSEYQRIRGAPGRLVAEFHSANERPAPVVMFSPQVQGLETRFQWEASHDFQGNPFTYEFALASEDDFDPEDILFQQVGVSGTELRVATPPPGTYFWRIVTRDSQGNWQTGFHEFEPFTVPAPAPAPQ
jgi:spore coat protein H